MRDNIVGAVIVVSALIWVPASCLVSYLDRKRLREEGDYRHHSTLSEEFSHPSTTTRVHDIKVLLYNMLIILSKLFKLFMN